MSKETGKSRVLTSSEFKRVVNMQKSNKHGIRNTCCLYISYFLGLRAKEIANLSHVSTRAIEMSRYRLRKKLSLKIEANLIDFLMKIQ